MELRLIDFLEIAASIVAAWPDGDKLTRPNTFAMLNSLDDLNTDNLLKDGRYINNDIWVFFSRVWQQNKNAGNVSFKYPMIGVTVSRIELASDYIGNDEMRLNIYVLDQMPSAFEVKEKDVKSTQTVESLIQDLKYMLGMFIKQLSRFVYGWYDPGTGQIDGWYNLDYILSNEYAHHYDFELCNYLTLKELSAEVFTPIGSFNDNVAGIFTNITLSEEYCFPDIDNFDYSDKITVKTTNSC